MSLNTQWQAWDAQIHAVWGWILLFATLVIAYALRAWIRGALRRNPKAKRWFTIATLVMFSAVIGLLIFEMNQPGH